MSTADRLQSDQEVKIFDGAEKLSIGIVTSEWNPEVCQSLLNGAKKTLIKGGVLKSNIKSIAVPGSFELTTGAALLLKSQKFDAVICLGCVVKGETRHDEYINQSVALGLTQLSIASGIPAIFGLLTTENMQQALDRAGGKYGNKGSEAAITAIKMALLSKSLLSTKSSIGF
jgi:6,7-dimethyl-8-ribityllumazine synthase